MNSSSASESAQDPAQSCCAPTLARGVSRLDGDRAETGPSEAFLSEGADSAFSHQVRQISVPSGSFEMGDHGGDRNLMDGETPVHTVDLAEFQIDATTVTNNDFAQFVAATGYRTEAEVFGWSSVFHLLVAADQGDVRGSFAQTPWWLGVDGADWKHPGGRKSDLDGLERHPAVHVSWNDAMAYCQWAGRRLPTEAEWEYAARGGLAAQRFPWGDELCPGGQWQCNIWQGEFPRVNTAGDGYVGTAPVDSFAPNAWGLDQMVGNVWEWCSDWFHPRYYGTSPTVDPRGPDVGTARVMRGGSYLCHDSYCNRYRNSARSSNTPDSSMGNAGFRTVSLAGSAKAGLQAPS